MTTADLFRPTARGVVGLVDDLLAACRGGSLDLRHEDGRCLVRRAGGEAVEVPLPRSAFRAVLARVAALCNERLPGSATPYCGEGELADPADPPAVFRAVFVNTPDEQHLQLRDAGGPMHGTNGFAPPG